LSILQALKCKSVPCWNCAWDTFKLISHEIASAGCSNSSFSERFKIPHRSTFPLSALI